MYTGSACKLPFKSYWLHLTVRAVLLLCTGYIVHCLYCVLVALVNLLLKTMMMMMMMMMIMMILAVQFRNKSRLNILHDDVGFRLFGQICRGVIGLIRTKEPEFYEKEQSVCLSQAIIKYWLRVVKRGAGRLTIPYLIRLIFNMTSTESPLAHAYHVCSSSIKAFVSHLANRWHRHAHGWSQYLFRLCIEASNKGKQNENKKLSYRW